MNRADAKGVARRACAAISGAMCAVELPPVEDAPQNYRDVLMWYEAPYFPYDPLRNALVVDGVMEREAIKALARSVSHDMPARSFFRVPGDAFLHKSERLIVTSGAVAVAVEWFRVGEDRIGERRESPLARCGPPMNRRRLLALLPAFGFGGGLLAATGAPVTSGQEGGTGEFVETGTAVLDDIFRQALIEGRKKTPFFTYTCAWDDLRG